LSVGYTDTDFISVLHPGIRVSWMREHWGAKFFKKAESTLKKMVSQNDAMVGLMVFDNTGIDGAIQAKARRK
jgi:hypothetical protein